MVLFICSFNSKFRLFQLILHMYCTKLCIDSLVTFLFVFCGISSHAGGIKNVDKRVAWAVELVANLKVLGRDDGVRNRVCKNFNFSL